MTGFLVRRMAWALVVLLAVGVITFLLVYALPTDPARAIAGPRANAASVRAISEALGLDDPLPAQLLRYLGNLAQGDFGHSFQRNREVLPLLLERLPATLQLAVGGLVLELLIGIPLGVLAARHAGALIDRAATTLASVLIAAPSFLVGYLLLNLLAFQPRVNLGIDLLPIGGYEPFDLRYLFLPALTLGFSGAAYYVRLTRATLLDELSRDYVRTARSKGLSERRVTWRHLFPNACLPLLTQFGLDAGFFLGGVVVVEQVFGWPGIGRLAVESIVSADVPMVMGTVLFATLAIVLANLAVDVAYALIDPRLRNQ
ncbi:MAG TPA: ABC transporter permease [Candidatus Dormibacteraeota bacterium]|nr:ABC transporter permease [Candidatus Dormibacteraeota bacterium]